MYSFVRLLLCHHHPFGFQSKVSIKRSFHGYSCKLNFTSREGSQCSFLDPDISLNGLAELLNISPHKLSQVINENLCMNFNDYLNKYRIDYAIKLLSSPDQHKFTTEAIALKAGFNSRSPFYNAFKKQIGLTPRQYNTNSGNGLAFTEPDS